MDRINRKPNSVIVHVLRHARAQAMSAGHATGVSRKTGQEKNLFASPADLHKNRLKFSIMTMCN